MFTLPAAHSKYSRCYRPRHPLAQSIITQIDKREQRPQDIVKAMGYPLKHTIPACDRLRQVLSSATLGLDGSYIDAYFTPESFLEELFAVLEMDAETFEENIAQIKYGLAHVSQPLPSYSLQADVDFTFNGSSNWLSRWGASLSTRVQLPSGFAKLSEAERKAVIKKSIRAHYRQYEGNVPYDGILKGYQLTISQNDEMADKVMYKLPSSTSA